MHSTGNQQEVIVSSQRIFLCLSTNSGDKIVRKLGYHEDKKIKKLFYDKQSFTLSTCPKLELYLHDDGFQKNAY